MIISGWLVAFVLWLLGGRLVWTIVEKFATEEEILKWRALPKFQKLWVLAPWPFHVIFLLLKGRSDDN